MSENKELIKALQAAYEVCVEVEDFTNNVLASDHKKDWNESDVKNNKNAKTYIKWYRKRVLSANNKPT